MARTACLACLISNGSGHGKKKQRYLGRCGTSSEYITKLKQSTFLRYLWSKQKHYYGRKAVGITISRSLLGSPQGKLLDIYDLKPQ
jgi:hypothetical protein